MVELNVIELGSYKWGQLLSPKATISIALIIMRSNTSLVTKDDNMNSSVAEPERPASSGEFYDSMLKI